MCLATIKEWSRETKLEVLGREMRILIDGVKSGQM